MKEKLRQPLFQLLLLLNIAAVLIGFWYYFGQLASTPLPLLPFVPDCPLYVLLAIPILFGLRNAAYSFLTSIGMAKYGLWTIFVLLFHSQAYFSPELAAVSIIFIFGHAGMVLEGLALLPKKRVGAAVLLLAIGWFLLNDLADYSLGTVPPIPTSGMGAVRNLTIAASLVLPLALFLYAEKLRSFAPVKFFRWLVAN